MPANDAANDAASGTEPGDGLRLVYGCMRLAERGEAAGFAAIEAALSAGYRQFDHADIYAQGESEVLFGRFLAANPGLRQDMVVASKCGIRFAGDPEPTSPKRYDFSGEHIRRSVERSLKRLNTEYLDVLLLHRPDYLMDADLVAVTFDRLLSDGLVRRFGVSNFSVSQVELLQSRLGVPLCIHQFEINLRNIDALANGTLDQCQARNMTPQAWSPLAAVAHAGWGDALSAEADERLRRELDRQAKLYACRDWQLVLAWLLLHPAGIAPVLGSTNSQRIAAAADALAIDYQRDDWYRLLEARNGQPVP